ncbi:MAG: NAD(P)/FAD-dependent oxidoreductase [Telluria sp.]
MADLIDTLIVGGGPGGLTAAIYLRRFRRRVTVIDKGHSRLALIPTSHNYPGFPEGVHGADLLARLREQLAQYGGEVTAGEVLQLERSGEGFLAHTTGGPVAARTVLLATGVADGGMPVEGWREALACGAVRLCPVCDGYDVLDRNVAVISGERNPVGHALFIRTFSDHVTLFERGPASGLTEADRARLRAARVALAESPVTQVALTERRTVQVHAEDGTQREFDVVYPMLGESARSGLASALGAEVAECDELVVDHHQQTTVRGLFAVGDVVRGLNQIAVACGQAAVAATAIHNRLPARYR